MADLQNLKCIYRIKRGLLVQSNSVMASHYFFVISMNLLNPLLSYRYYRYCRLTVMYLVSLSFNLLQ